MKEASFYISTENNKVKCFLCPKECEISKGNTGVCGGRENIDGKLYALTYSKPVAIHLDPIEKKPLYHFYPGSQVLSIGTLGCNLGCEFCQNYDISQEFSTDDFKKIKETTPLEILGICKKHNYKFIAFTYNEPSIYFEYMLDIAKLCKAYNIKTIVVSNGQINPEPLKELINYIDAFNIDLKSYNNEFYKKICKGDLQTTINTITEIVDSRKHIEVTFLLIEGLNDSEEEFIEMCKFLSGLNKDIVLHISRAFPRYKSDFEPTPIKLILKFQTIAKRFLKNTYTGNI